jgi:hypothetical protein
MIKELPESGGAYLGFEITGKVSFEQEREMIDRIEQATGEHGAVSVLVEMKEQARWGVKAGLEDLKWVMTHLKQLNKIAIVSESTVWKWLIALDSPFAKLVGVNEKHFETDDIVNAWIWLRE